MAKKKTIRAKEDEAQVIETSLDQVKGIIEADKLDKALTSTKGAQLFQALDAFAALDHEMEQQSESAGEVIDRLLTLPLEVQKRFVWAYADQKGVARPTYTQEGAGRPTTGRNELAAVLYARYPDMLVKDKGKDTRGAKRLTDHRRRFLIRTGQRKTTRQIAGHVEGAPPDRALKLVFVAMWSAAQNETERRTIVSLYIRLGVDPEAMDKWTHRGLLALAAAPLSARIIEAEPIRDEEPEPGKKKVVGD